MRGTDDALRVDKGRAFQNGARTNLARTPLQLQKVYRVLSIRGMKGTYSYFLDPSTRRHYEDLAV